MTGKTFNQNPFIFEDDIEIETRGRKRTVARGEKFQTPEGDKYEKVIHSIQEVDKAKFVKIFISRVRVLFDLRKVRISGEILLG